MTSESISGIVSVVIAVALAWACAVSSGTLAALLAATAGLLPIVWVLRAAPAPE